MTSYLDLYEHPLTLWHSKKLMTLCLPGCLINDINYRFKKNKRSYPLSVAIVSIQFSWHSLDQYTQEICVAHTFYIGNGNDEKYVYSKKLIKNSLYH